MSRVILFANGLLPDLETARRLLRTKDTLLAADGGTRHALALGLVPSVVIGDLDSLSQAECRLLEQAGTAFHKHPRDKDETDLELALNYVLDNGFRHILVIGGLGGRLDQVLANLTLLANPRLSAVDIRLDDGLEEAFFILKQARIKGSAGEIVSLIPWGGQVTGVTTSGLRWPLHEESLFPGKTRGISNELLVKSATITLQSGLLLVVHRRQSSIANQKS